MALVSPEDLFKQLVRQNAGGTMAVDKFNVSVTNTGRIATLEVGVNNTTGIDDVDGDIYDVIEALADSFNGLPECKSIRIEVPTLHLYERYAAKVIQTLATRQKTDFEENVMNKLISVFGNGMLNNLEIFGKEQEPADSNNNGLYLMIASAVITRLSLTSLTLHNVGLDAMTLQALCSEFLSDNFVIKSLSLVHNTGVSNNDIVTILLPCLMKTYSVTMLDVTCHDLRPDGMTEVDAYNQKASDRQDQGVYKGALLVTMNDADTTEIVSDIMCSTITYPTPNERVMLQSPISELVPHECVSYHPIWTYNQNQLRMFCNFCLLAPYNEARGQHDFLVEYRVDAVFWSDAEINSFTAADLRSDVDMIARRPKSIVLTKGTRAAENPQLAQATENTVFDAASKWCKNATIAFELKQ